MSVEHLPDSPDGLKRVRVPLSELTILRPGEKPPSHGCAITLPEPAYAAMVLRQQAASLQPQ